MIDGAGADNVQFQGDDSTSTTALFGASELRQVRLYV